MLHPIAKLLENGFDHFFSLVNKEVEAGNIDRTDLDNGLTLLDYSRDCQFNEAWNSVTEVCRGLIVDRFKKVIVGLSMPKFYNVNQNGTTFKDLPYVAHEKLDGSMGLIWRYDGKLNVSTRGSFSSPQAIKGYEMLRDKYPMAEVTVHKNVVLVTEILYPENKIVVDYKGAEKLVLLTAYDNERLTELDEDAVDLLAFVIGMDRPLVYNFESFLDLEKTVKSWPKDQEGVVVKFSDGTRCKIKGDDYCTTHKLISHFSPLAVWESIRDGIEMDFIAQLPDEFQEQYKVWRENFISQGNAIWQEVLRLHNSTKELSDKELGLKIQAGEFGDFGGMIFGIRKNGTSFDNVRARRFVFERFKPKANVMRKFEE